MSFVLIRRILCSSRCCGRAAPSYAYANTGPAAHIRGRAELRVTAVLVTVTASFAHSATDSRNGLGTNGSGTKVPLPFLYVHVLSLNKRIIEDPLKQRAAT